MKNGKSNVLDYIGDTPLVELSTLSNPTQAEVYAKLEGGNPGGSVKDRPAYWMVKKAEKSGELTAEKTILEPTSGNTGIGLALVGASKGYHVKLTMPDCVSVERRRVLEALGAELVLTPAEQGTDGAIQKAGEIREDSPSDYYMPNQFSNENNPLSHYETTGPEIFSQTEGQIDCFVAGMGTTGTLMGTGRYLKEKKPSIKVVGVEPPQGHTIQGLKNMDEAAIPEIYQPELLDEKITIGDERAFRLARLLAKQEGIFVGMSSGAAVAAALKVAEDTGRVKIVTLLPDRGERYLSTTLFRSVCGKCPP
ncbi:cysteine synthase A [Candidatus Bipolaricaulota bacterium]|nr:cysteine synthase A [Candidatus Bipolaricaulota bacterium]